MAGREPDDWFIGEILPLEPIRLAKHWPEAETSSRPSTVFVEKRTIPRPFVSIRARSSSRATWISGPKIAHLR